uniref:Protein FMC1 homolog n=1 Tax=Strongyloides venezuelensis TaxID=75913 RepID=A0A0K0F0V4_STRVS
MNSRLAVNFRKIFKEILPIPEKNFLEKDFYLKKLSSYQKNTSSNIIINSPNAEDEMNNTYASYLIATKRLSSLQEEYKGGERSIEESASLVGLALPEKRQNEV